MRQVVRLAVLIAASLAMVGIASAQTATGQITGTVRDSSGAVLPNAKVTVTNQGTRVTRDTVSTGSGDYTFRLLPVGTYTVSAEQK